MTTLKALKFEIEIEEGIFRTKRETTLYFGSTKPEELEESLKGIVEAIKKELQSMFRKGNYRRPQINLYGMDMNYHYVDGFRYIVGWDGKLEFRKWIPTARQYDVDRIGHYTKRVEGYYEKVDTAKLVRELTKQLQQDAIDFSYNYNREEYSLELRL